MKRNYLMLVLLGSLVLATSCNNGGNDHGDEPIPPVVNKYVDFNPSVNAPSRATDTSFEIGDAISIFAVKSNNNDVKGVIADYGNYADNIEYVYNGTKFSPQNIGIEKPINGEKIYYHAVYPYSSSIKNKFVFSVNPDQSTMENYAVSDLLTASSNATDAQLVPLKFDHRLCKLVINLSGENLPSGNVKITLKDIYTTVSVDLNTLTFTPTGSKSDIICSSNGTLSFKVILPPQSIVKGSTLAVVTVGGKNYPVISNSDAVIHSGTQRDFSFVWGTDDKIIEFTGDINPWDTTPSEPGGGSDNEDEIVYTTDNGQTLTPSVYKAPNGKKYYLVGPFENVNWYEAKKLERGKWHLPRTKGFSSSCEDYNTTKVTFETLMGIDHFTDDYNDDFYNPAGFTNIFKGGDNYWSGTTCEKKDEYAYILSIGELESGLMEKNKQSNPKGDDYCAILVYDN